VSKRNAHTRPQFETFSELWPLKAKPEKKRYILNTEPSAQVS